MGRNLVIASKNSHKIQEIAACLGPNWNTLGVTHFDPKVKWDETADSFLENAKIKLNALKKIVGDTSKYCILADDSGLCVSEFGGLPGVHSSSYGGVEGDHVRNLNQLISAIKEVPQQKRQAFFYCLLLFVDENGVESVFEGRCDGIILDEPRGHQGFGYDPVFYLPDLKKTMAELSEDQKNKRSHRGIAMQKLLIHLEINPLLLNNHPL